MLANVHGKINESSNNLLDSLVVLLVGSENKELE